MNYQATLSFGAATGATAPWSFRASLIPHPVNFFAYEVTDNLGVVQAEFNNPQLAGANHGAKYVIFAGMAQRWRLAYASVTLHQDGPSLANQGSIVVSQPPVEPYVSRYGTSSTVTNSFISSVPAHSFGNEDYPNFNTSQSMPNAYFARSKDGVYVPLKLTSTCQNWTSDADAVTNDSPRFGGATNNFMLADYNPHFTWPHWSTETLTMNLATGALACTRTSPLLNATVAHICAENLSPESRITCFFRFGIEIQVSPSSVLAPQQHLSPEYDPVALDTYFRIARELKDAYPADFNDLGKIWDSIASAAQTVLPMLKTMGPYGQALSLGGRAVVTAGNAIRTSRQKKKASAPVLTKTRGDRGNPPAAQIERARTDQVVRDAVATQKSKSGKRPQRSNSR